VGVVMMLLMVQMLATNLKFKSIIMNSIFFNNLIKYIKIFFITILILLILKTIVDTINLQRTKTVKVRTVNGKVTRTVQYK
jgi:hypothetical protein